MTLRLQHFGHEEIVVHEETKRFKVGNGDTQKATSFIELPQTIDGTTLTLGVHAIDAPGVPLLLSVRTLRKMGAIIDTESRTACNSVGFLMLGLLSSKVPTSTFFWT